MADSRFPHPLFIALDTPDLSRALALGSELRPYVGGYKIGLEFISAQGPDGVRAVVDLGLPVFADVKFHDIPNTVAGASRALAALGIAIFNVHASGGEAMLRAAVEAAAEAEHPPRVLAVTTLTSLTDDDLKSVGQMTPAAAQVVRLAELAKRCRLDGVVCSPLEIEMVRSACGEDFLIATPGIRPGGAELADQRRVTTPVAARKAGADIVIIGRPITEATDPARVVRTIALELGQTFRAPT